MRDDGMSMGGGGPWFNAPALPERQIPTSPDSLPSRNQAELKAGSPGKRELPLPRQSM